MADNSDNFMVGDIEVSPQHNTMCRGESSCRLQPKVMALLHYLAKNNDRVIGNDELLDKVWEGRVVTHSSIQKSVNALRSAFTELDSGCEYIVHFSKRGYQLVTSGNIEVRETHLGKKSWINMWGVIGIAVASIIGCYLAYVWTPFIADFESSPIKPYVTEFSQVKPYVSNTGSERVVEPHAASERVAFVKNEIGGEVGSTSRLFIKGVSGHEWPVSVARGEFVDLAWSPSGRNLVAIDVHSASESEQGVDGLAEASTFYTFHIYTLDFKGEKVIEKNLLSHWLGKVRSISWWDEGVLEFVASQGDLTEGGDSLEDGLGNARYRYSIADQNLTKFEARKSEGQLLSSQLLNKAEVELTRVSTGMSVEFFDAQQQSQSRRLLPFRVVSMSWISDGGGVLLSSDDNRLFLLYKDGTLLDVDYSPKVSGRISRVRSLNNGKHFVVTVESATRHSPSTEPKMHIDVPSEAPTVQFMAKGGGFIYSAAPSRL